MIVLSSSNCFIKINVQMGHRPQSGLYLPLSHDSLFRQTEVREVYNYCPLLEFNAECILSESRWEHNYAYNKYGSSESGWEDWNQFYFNCERRMKEEEVRDERESRNQKNCPVKKLSSKLSVTNLLFTQHRDDSRFTFCMSRVTSLWHHVTLKQCFLSCMF